MALFRPDEYRHNNSNYAISDIREVRGGSYSVDTINDRDGIPPNKRGRAIIYVIDISKLFTYIGPLNSEGDSRAEDVNWLNPNYWREITTGVSGGGGDFHNQSELKDLEVQYTSIETDNQPIVGEEISYSGATWVNTYNSDGSRAIGIQINLGFSSESIADFSESHILSPSVNFKYDFPGIGAAFEINGIDTDGGAVLGEAPYNIRWNHELLFGYLSDITDANLISDIQSGVNVESTIKGYDTDNINSKAVLLGTTNTDDIINHTYIAYPKDFGKISNLFLNSGESIFNAFEEYSTTITITNKHGIDVEYYLYYSIDKGAIGSDQFITLIGSSDTGIGNSGGNVTFEDTNVEYNPALDELTIGFVDGTSGSTNILGAIFEGTYDELKTLKDNNQLVVGRQYILKDFETKFFIEGSNSDVSKTPFRVKGYQSGYANITPLETEMTPLPVNGDGHSIFATNTITTGSGTINTGDELELFSNGANSNYYMKIRRVSDQLPISSFPSLEFNIEYPRFLTSELAPNNGVDVLDSNGKSIFKVGGVLNTEVYDGLAYGDMANTPTIIKERLSITAISENEFSNFAESLTYIGDKLEYDFNDVDVKNDNDEIISDRKGVIIRRYNEVLNIDLNDDWRHKTFRRFMIDDEDELRKFFREYETYLPTGPDISIYHSTSNIRIHTQKFISKIFDTSADSVADQFKYVLINPENNKNVLDFTLGNTVANAFSEPRRVTGLKSTAYGTTVYDSYNETLQYNTTVNNKNILRFKDFTIIPLENGNEPNSKVKKLKVKNISNTIFTLAPPSEKGSSSGDLVVDYDGSITNTFFLSGMKVEGLGKIDNCLLLAGLILVNDGIITNSHMLANGIIVTDRNTIIDNTIIGMSTWSNAGGSTISFSNSTIVSSMISLELTTYFKINDCTFISSMLDDGSRRYVSNPIFQNCNWVQVRFAIRRGWIGTTISFSNFGMLNKYKSHEITFTWDSSLLQSGNDENKSGETFYLNTSTNNYEYFSTYSISEITSISSDINGTLDNIIDSDGNEISYELDSNDNNCVIFHGGVNNIIPQDGEVFTLTFETEFYRGFDYNNITLNNNFDSNYDHREIRGTKEGVLYSTDVDENMQIIFNKIIEPK
jgi:hypothetical protein